MCVLNESAKITNTAVIINCATKPKATATMSNAAEILCAKRKLKDAKMDTVYA